MVTVEIGGGIEHIMRKAGLDESPVGIKIAGRNNNLRYADDTTLMAESEEELKSLLMRVKEESTKVGLKLSIKKTKIMAPSPLTSWQIDGEEMEVVTDFIFLGSKITADGDCSQEIKRCLLLGRKAMANLDSILKSRDITLPTKLLQLWNLLSPLWVMLIFSLLWGPFRIPHEPFLKLKKYLKPAMDKIEIFSPSPLSAFFFYLCHTSVNKSVVVLGPASVRVVLDIAHNLRRLWLIKTPLKDIHLILLTVHSGLQNDYFRVTSITLAYPEGYNGRWYRKPLRGPGGPTKTHSPSLSLHRSSYRATKADSVPYPGLKPD
ncbi:putative uncharacterized transposon-derived protein F52C9.6 [Varanus komodoensis]|nr:putative uncharacterized transposon-derived protein F52C9.6 [Varanus komodoensis]